jgi:hypothetical protein
MDALSFDPAFLEELRNKVRNGDTPVQAMRFVIDRLQLGPNRLMIIKSFRAAFGMELRDAKILTFWEFFKGGAWSDQAINDRIAPILSRCLHDYGSTG